MSPSLEDDENSEARRLALVALSLGDAAEALRLSKGAKPWVSVVVKLLLFYFFLELLSSHSLSLSQRPPPSN